MDIDNYNLDDNENPAWDGSTGDDNGNRKSQKSLHTLLKLLTTPVEGWKQLRRNGLTTKEISRECFFPLIALAACAKFSILFYHPSQELQTVIVDALITFTSFFVTLPCIILLAKVLFPSEVSEKIDSEYGKSMLMMVLSSFALFSIPYDLLPMLDPVLVFLPIWSIYILTKGVKFLKTSPRFDSRIKVLLSILTIGMPIFVNWLLNLILP